MLCAQVTGLPDSASESEGLSPEAPILPGIERPNVVGTLACAVGGTGPGGAPGTWRVLEFCNAGSLQVNLDSQGSEHCAPDPSPCEPYFIPGVLLPALCP